MVSGVLDDLMGKFSGNLTYSESPSLSLELAANMMSLSGSAGFMSVTAGPSVGHEWFEFIFPLSMVAGVAVLGSVVLERS